MSKIRFICLILIIFSITSCSLFVQKDTENYVARVNDHFLTQKEVDNAMRETVVVDSVIFVQGYINNWATNQLLLDGAIRNVAKAEQDKFESLVSAYKSDLYTKHYLDILINKQLDSVVSASEATEFYENNKRNFKLNEPLVQFRFIQLDTEYDITELKEHFKNDKEEDVKIIDSLKFQYKDYFLNDAIWVKKNEIVQRVNPVNKDNVTSILKKSNFLELRDSLGLYLIAVKNTLDRNDMAPLQYVRPTINQIILNKRKLALIKKLEKEIKDDAIKNKQFEVYD